jgi:hypothetical protein
MKRTQSNPKRQILRYRSPLIDLWRVIDHLNLPPLGTSETDSRAGRDEGQIVRNELRRLVDLWRSSGPNLQKMMQKYPEIHPKVRKWKVLFIPTKSGNAQLQPFPPTPGRGKSWPKNLALSYFMMLITNPLWEKLGGPCARCSKFYVKATIRQNVYCSKACARTETAVKATRRQREKERKGRISRAQDVIDRWVSSQKSPNWKERVSRETGLTLNWLTRAINKKDLRPPSNV